MAREAKKQQTKARINWGWDAPQDRKGKATRSSSRQVNKKIKKLGFKSILIVLLVTIIGVAIGSSICWFVGRNDGFTLIGVDELTLTLANEGDVISKDNSYYDEGVKIVSFGRDISKNVIIETDMIINNDGSFTATDVGTYYIKYKVDDIKYGKIFTIERIRLITFVESMPID